jgi:hypothetical protein
MRRRRILCSVAPLGAALVIGLPAARADEPASDAAARCNAAFEAAELLLRPSEARLLDARAALRACALPACKEWMVDDCSKRLVEVDRRVPSVAFSAEDARGAPLHDVRVLDGEREVSARLDGRAVEMDPGAHELVGERDGVRVPISVVLIEGRKAQQVVFRFPGAPAAEASPAPAAPREPARLRHPWAPPVAGALVAGGVLASVIGVGFGVAAIDKKSDARCDAANVCDGDTLEDARGVARAATVSFIVAGALVLGGVFTYLVLGRSRAEGGR